MRLIETYSDQTKEKWSDVWGVNIYEFFNILAYNRSENERKTEQIRQWKSK